MRTHTIIRPLAGALLAACALAVAACGGGDPGGTASAAERDSKARDAMLEYARCMREHGVDFPDPKRNGSGAQTFSVGPGGDASPEEFQDADKACRHYMKDVEPPELSDEQQQEFKEAALANARCMRAHGVEHFPDPTFGDNGEARIQIDKGSGVNPNDADFKKAQEACKDTLPEGPTQESAP
jgi:hypothetical protein